MSLTQDELVNHLNQFLLKVQISRNKTVLEQQVKMDESYHKSKHSDLVLYPYKTEDVSQILKSANDNNIKVVPFGLGKSLEGHIIAYKQLTIYFSVLNKVLNISLEVFLVTVQPRVTC